MRSEVTATRITGSASASLFTTCGSSASSGRSPRTRPTASRTSLAATSISTLVSNSMVTRLRPCRLSELMVRMPEIAAIAPSTVSVMSVSITSGAAPR
jgi:hypothetical protein